MLETNRLFLRMFKESDLDDFAMMCADKEVMRYIGPGDILSRQDAWYEMAMFIGHWQLKNHGMWAVEEKQSGKLIGRVGFHYPEGWPGFEIGWLLKKESWGQGFATEAATAAIQFGRDNQPHQQIISLIYPANARSIRVIEKIGGKFDKTINMLNSDVSVYKY